MRSKSLALLYADLGVAKCRPAVLSLDQPADATRVRGKNSLNSPVSCLNVVDTHRAIQLGGTGAGVRPLGFLKAMDSPLDQQVSRSVTRIHRP